MLPYSFDLVDCQVLPVTRKIISYAKHASWINLSAPRISGAAQETMDRAQVTAASRRHPGHLSVSRVWSHLVT
jgi:hypothetical protein